MRMVRWIILVVLAAVLPLGNQATAVTQTVGLASPTAQTGGTITAGGTFQQVFAASNDRKSFEFDNTNSAHTCYIFFGATAAATTAKSIPAPAGSYYLRSQGSIPSDAIQVTCSNTSDTFYAAVQ